MVFSLGLSDPDIFLYNRDPSSGEPTGRLSWRRASPVSVSHSILFRKYIHTSAKHTRGGPEEEHLIGTSSVNDKV